MIQIALSNTEFTKAVESELEKAKGNAGEMLRRFRENTSSLTNLNGARQVQQSIDRELMTDIQNINTAGEHMKNSAASIMNKQVNAHSRGRKQVEYAREASSSSLPSVNNYFDVLLRRRGLLPERMGIGI